MSLEPEQSIAFQLYTGISPHSCPSIPSNHPETRPASTANTQRLVVVRQPLRDQPERRARGPAPLCVPQLRQDIYAQGGFTRFFFTPPSFEVQSLLASPCCPFGLPLSLVVLLSCCLVVSALGRPLSTSIILDGRGAQSPGHMLQSLLARSPACRRVGQSHCRASLSVSNVFFPTRTTGPPPVIPGGPTPHCAAPCGFVRLQKGVSGPPRSHSERSEYPTGVLVSHPNSEHSIDPRPFLWTLG